MNASRAAVDRTPSARKMARRVSTKMMMMMGWMCRCCLCMDAVRAEEAVRTRDGLQLAKKGLVSAQSLQ